MILITVVSLIFIKLGGRLGFLWLAYWSWVVITTIGLVTIFLKYVNNEEPGLGDLFANSGLFLSAAAGITLYFLIIFAGLLILIITSAIWIIKLIPVELLEISARYNPGMLFDPIKQVSYGKIMMFTFVSSVLLFFIAVMMIKFRFVVYLIVDKRLGAIDAFKKSAEITTGNVWNLFQLDLLLICIVFAIYFVVLAVFFIIGILGGRSFLDPNSRGFGISFNLLQTFINFFLSLLATGTFANVYSILIGTTEDSHILGNIPEISDEGQGSIP